MLSDHLLDNHIRLFHISEQPGIEVFEPRPSPSYFPGITANVVFAITDVLLHNYLLPRNCPRVTWYCTSETSMADKERFMRNTTASHIIAVESDWYKRIKEATLFCYEFYADNFSLLDACAGYCVSYHAEVPCSVTVINDIMTELLSRNIELRFTPSLNILADAVSKSTLNFSIIRMRNAKK